MCVDVFVCVSVGAIEIHQPGVGYKRGKRRGCGCQLTGRETDDAVETKRASRRKRQRGTGRAWKYILVHPRDFTTKPVRLEAAR